MLSVTGDPIVIVVDIDVIESLTFCPFGCTQGGDKFCGS
jgi:hypothetical protein